MNRFFYTITLTLCMAAVFLWANPTQAGTILDQSAFGGSGDSGNYEGFYFMLSDAGFALTGDPLPQVASLQSLTYMKAPTRPGETVGDLYLKVFAGATGGLGTFVGVSSDTVDAAAANPGDLSTWMFGGLLLDKDTVYSYVVDTVNDSSNPTATLGVQLSSPTNPLTSGGELNGDASADAAWDAFLQISIDNSSVILGDFDGIGGVTAADYGILKDNWLTTGNAFNTNGEVTNDGIVDGSDFRLFKETLFLGPASALTSAVPEPSTVVLMLAAIPTWLLLRSSRWKE